MNNPSKRNSDEERYGNVHYRTVDFSPFTALGVGDSAIAKSGSDTWLSQASEPDLVQQLLSDKRSPNTRRAYAKDLKDFFGTIANSDPTPELVSQFLRLDRFSAIALVVRYKAQLIERGLAEATVNRRLAAIKSLVKLARRLGKCEFTLEDVEGERVKAYRDTTGIDTQSFKKMLAVPDRDTLKGKRDYALLLLLWSNGLRRSEASQATIKDFEPHDQRLWILGKGRGSQKESVDLNKGTTEALLDWLQSRPSIDVNAPLFISLSHWQHGHALTGKSIYLIIRQCAEAAGINKRISPHRIRHSAITALLDANNGNTRQAQSFSRHSSADILRKYDDNRLRLQKGASDLLGDLL